MALPDNINDRWYDMFTTDGAGEVALRILGTAGGVVPGGPDTAVQFNSGGAFGGDAGLTFVGGNLISTGRISANVLLTPSILSPLGDVSVALDDALGRIVLMAGVTPTSISLNGATDTILMAAGAGGTFVLASAGDSSAIGAPGVFTLGANGDVYLSSGGDVRLESVGGEWRIDNTGAFFSPFGALDIGTLAKPINFITGVGIQNAAGNVSLAFGTGEWTLGSVSTSIRGDDSDLILEMSVGGAYVKLDDNPASITPGWRLGHENISVVADGTAGLEQFTVSAGALGNWVFNGVTGVLTTTGGIVVGTSIVTPLVNFPLTAPGSPVDGDTWVEASGTSPARVVSLMVQDGGTTHTVASITY